MDHDAIAEVGIDAQGRLYVSPLTKKFPHIYREAMEVYWDAANDHLCAPPPPRAQRGAVWWFQKIVTAAKEQGCELLIGPETKWKNIPHELAEEISSSGEHHA